MVARSVCLVTTSVLSLLFSFESLGCISAQRSNMLDLLAGSYEGLAWNLPDCFPRSTDNCIAVTSRAPIGRERIQASPGGLVGMS